VIHRRKPDRLYEPKLDGRGEAHLIALACSPPPEGRSCWTYALLVEHLVTLEETVRQRLKNILKPHRSKSWLIPTKHDATFVYQMEVVLSLYYDPYDPARMVIFFDEASKTLR